MTPDCWGTAIAMRPDASVPIAYGRCATYARSRSESGTNYQARARFRGLHDAMRRPDWRIVDATRFDDDAARVTEQSARCAAQTEYELLELRQRYCDELHVRRQRELHSRRAARDLGDGLLRASNDLI